MPEGALPKRSLYSAANLPRWLKPSGGRYLQRIYLRCPFQFPMSRLHPQFFQVCHRGCSAKLLETLLQVRGLTFTRPQSVQSLAVAADWLHELNGALDVFGRCDIPGRLCRIRIVMPNLLQQTAEDCINRLRWVNDFERSRYPDPNLRKVLAEQAEQPSCLASAFKCHLNWMFSRIVWPCSSPSFLRRSDCEFSSIMWWQSELYSRRDN